MKIRINNRTSYSYSKPVFLEPHFLRLRPREDPAQHVLEFSLDISPEPGGLGYGLDPDSNWLTSIWFDKQTEVLEVAVKTVVETLRSNPFDFVLTSPEFSMRSSLYTDDLRQRLGHVLTPIGGGAASELAHSVGTKEGLMAYLTGLNSLIKESFQVVYREFGNPLTPAETIEAGAGACRDLAVLFIDACRTVGIAARFASGYLAASDVPEEHTLHAWAEVYLPGAGWRGFDPTLGLMVADAHVCLAVSSLYVGAAPLTGAFRGTGASSKMTTLIEVERLDGKI